MRQMKPSHEQATTPRTSVQSVQPPTARYAHGLNGGSLPLPSLCSSASSPAKGPFDDNFCCGIAESWLQVEFSSYCRIFIGSRQGGQLHALHSPTSAGALRRSHLKQTQTSAVSHCNPMHPVALWFVTCKRKDSLYRLLDCQKLPFLQHPEARCWLSLL